MSSRIVETKAKNSSQWDSMTIDEYEANHPGFIKNIDLNKKIQLQKVLPRQEVEYEFVIPDGVKLIAGVILFVVVVAGLITG